MTSCLDPILGFVVGDALGVPIEFKSRESLAVKPLKEMMGYGSHSVPSGTWSDDSSMLIATMDSIIEKNSIDYNDIMKKFLEWFTEAKYTATGNVFDIGISTRKALVNFHNGIPALNCGGKGEYDNGNGSLMRILPVVLYSYYNGYSELEEVKLLNNVSALTHGHEISKLGCKIYADFVKFLIDGDDKKIALKKVSLKDYQKYYSKETISKYSRILNGNLGNLDVNDIKSSGFVIDTLEASIWSVLTTQTYEDAVVKAINLGEDTDTVGAVTGSLAGIIYGNENIPKRWKDEIKNKEFLFDTISKYDETIINKNKKVM